MDNVYHEFTPALIIPLLVGILFILIGCILNFFPPKKINRYYGYRTPRAMKSKERWDFAQRFSARELIGWGVVNVLAALAAYWFKLSVENSNILTAILVTVSVIALVVRTEMAISRKFGKSQ